MPSTIIGEYLPDGTANRRGGLKSSAGWPDLSVQLVLCDRYIHESDCTPSESDLTAEIGFPEKHQTGTGLDKPRVLLRSCFIFVFKKAFLFMTLSFLLSNFLLAKRLHQKTLMPLSSNRLLPSLLC